MHNYLKSLQKMMFSHDVYSSVTKNMLVRQFIQLEDIEIPVLIVVLE